MLLTSLLMCALASGPVISAEAGVTSAPNKGGSIPFAALRLTKPFLGVKTQIEVSGDRDVRSGDAKAHVRLGVFLERLSVRLTADRNGTAFEPGGEVRLNLVPRFTVFAEGKAGVSTSVFKVGAKYASDRVTCTLEGSSNGDASMVVSLLLI